MTEGSSETPPEIVDQEVNKATSADQNTPSVSDAFSRVKKAVMGLVNLTSDTGDAIGPSLKRKGSSKTPEVDDK